jgi:hypothetical protein
VIDRLLESAGIPIDLPAAEKAVALVRSFPLRFDGGARSRDASTVLESGWFAGAGECVRVLAEVYHGRAGRGTAFGGSWPYLEVGDRLLAPAVPVVVKEAETKGPDGAYRLQDGAVWREAVGQDQPMLDISGSPVVLGGRFDLLWFGHRERYLVRGDTLEIEDLFSLMRMPLESRFLDRFLPRVRRRDVTVVADLSFAGSTRQPTVEVRRHREMVHGETWRDPRRLISSWAGVRGVERSGDHIIVERDRDEQVVLNVVEERDGWRAFGWEDAFSFQGLALLQHDDVLSLTGTLSRELDPLTHGLRERLAFDLNADLVALGDDEPLTGDSY